MTADHLTDEQVQQYVEESMQLIPSALKHLGHCEDCQKRAEVYRLLMSGIELQPEAVLDFDVSEVVMPQLVPQGQRPSGDRFLSPALVFAGILLAGISLAAFGRYMSNFFAGKDALSVLMVIAPVMAIVIFLFAEAYKNFRSKLDMLNIQ